MWLEEQKPRLVVAQSLAQAFSSVMSWSVQTARREFSRPLVAVVVWRLVLAYSILNHSSSQAGPRNMKHTPRSLKSCALAVLEEQGEGELRAA